MSFSFIHQQLFELLKTVDSTALKTTEQIGDVFHLLKVKSVGLATTPTPKDIDDAIIKAEKQLNEGVQLFQEIMNTQEKCHVVKVIALPGVASKVLCTRPLRKVRKINLCQRIT